MNNQILQKRVDFLRSCLEHLKSSMEYQLSQWTNKQHTGTPWITISAAQKLKRDLDYMIEQDNEIDNKRT